MSEKWNSTRRQSWSYHRAKQPFKFYFKMLKMWNML